MTRHVIKQLNQKTSAKTQTKNPSQLRQEIDTCVRHITQVVERDPKKAAKIFEAWLQGEQAIDKKKRAA